MSYRRHTLEDRDTGNLARTTRWAWLLLNWALAADIFYRSGVLRQDLGAYADILFIWLGALVFYAIAALSAEGFVIVAAEVSFIPTIVLALAVATAAIFFVNTVNAWLVAGGILLVVLFATLAMALVWRRERV